MRRYVTARSFEVYLKPSDPGGDDVVQEGARRGALASTQEDAHPEVHDTGQRRRRLDSAFRQEFISESTGRSGSTGRRARYEGMPGV